MSKEQLIEELQKKRNEKVVKEINEQVTMYIKENKKLMFEL
jgi:hypothetical protein